jgi:hypothetical protein
MGVFSTNIAESNGTRPQARRGRAGRTLLAFATVFVGVGCLFVGQAAALPVPGSHECTPDAFGPLPATNAARRACAGLTSPKVPLTVEENKDGVFKLSAPSSIDITKPVACGAAIGGNCVYHHWQWTPSVGATVVNGCNPNDKICEVKINPYDHWAMVYFGVDNDPEVHVFDLSNGAATPANKPTVALLVALSTSAQSGKLPVGDSVAVTVKVTAEGGSVGSIALGLGAQGSAVAVTSQPSGARDFSLGKGSSRSFTFKVKGVSNGTATLVATADGKTATGTSTRGSGSEKLKVGGSALAIAVSATPAEVKLLEVYRAGKATTSVTVTVKVTLTNGSKSAIDGVQLLSLIPVPVDHTQALNKLVFPGGVFPFKMGTVAPGSSISKSFTLDVAKGNGKYQVEALALYDDPISPGGNARAFAAGGPFEVVQFVLD